MELSARYMIINTYFMLFNRGLIKRNIERELEFCGKDERLRRFLKRIISYINIMAAALPDALTDSSLLSIMDEWWCPVCSDRTEDAPLCQMCHELLLQLVEDLPINDQEKSMMLYSQYILNRKQKDEQFEVDPSKPTSDNDRAILINSEAAASQILMSLTVRNRRHEHEYSAEILFKKIIKYCRQHNTHFVDDRFPPTRQSIGFGSFNQVSQWLRISNVAPSSESDRKLPWTLFSSPGPSDIQQGALGNCWLVAALALVSEQPRLLHHILLTKTVNSEGVYLVRICHNGLWKTIIVDDVFPCTKHKHLVFTQAKRRQLYVPLIEKACAKLFGSYAALRSGNIREGLQLLTGASCDYIDLKLADTELDSNVIWVQLLSSCEAKLLIGVSSGGTGVSSEEYARVRIHNNHAFSVLAAHAFDSQSLRFVLVRDPHSHSNYREGLLTENILKQLRLINPANHSTGAFWISWPRFLRYFSSLTISTYNSDYFDIREQSKFTRSSIHYVTSYHFHLPKPSWINVSLIHHHRDRTTRSSHTQSFVLCDADELAANGTIGKRKSILICKLGGHTYWSGLLEEGNYVLVPFSISFWQNDKGNRNFTVVIHSRVQLSLTVKHKPPTFLTDCLISAVIKDSKKKQVYAIFYTTSGKSGLNVFIVENLSINDYLNVDMDIQSARNVQHSRHLDFSDKIHDCIPPRYRQVICITEWLDRSRESSRFNYSYSYMHEKQATNPRPPIDTSRYDFHSPRAF
ncbi:unnamed protein product [Rotaria sp. Silwood2]|nr:unnamed protein product [Rotaria sp. Silwood2]